MNPKHLPPADVLDGQISRIVEESGEVLQAIGKIERFGLDSYHPRKGGLNNAAHMLSELADLRHAISCAEMLLTDHAKAVVLSDGDYRHDFVWTDTLITTAELRELIGDEDYDNDDDFNDEHTCVPVCAGQWHREVWSGASSSTRSWTDAYASVVERPSSGSWNCGCRPRSTGVRALASRSAPSPQRDASSVASMR